MEDWLDLLAEHRGTLHRLASLLTQAELAAAGALPELAPFRHAVAQLVYHRYALAGAARRYRAGEPPASALALARACLDGIDAWGNAALSWFPAVWAAAGPAVDELGLLLEQERLDWARTRAALLGL